MHLIMPYDGLETRLIVPIKLYSVRLERLHEERRGCINQRVCTDRRRAFLAPITP